MKPKPNRDAPPTDTIGGTAATYILGRSKWGGPHKAYRKLCSMDPVVPPTPRMQRGIKLEDAIAQAAQPYFHKRGRHIGELLGSGVIYHPEHSCIHSTIDRMVYDESGKPVGICEIKTFDSTRNQFDWSRHDYWTQTAHYGTVLSAAEGCELTEFYLTVLSAPETQFNVFLSIQDSLGKDALVEVLSRDFPPETRTSIECGVEDIVNIDNYARDVIPQLVGWYDKHIRNRLVPDPDGSDECKKTLLEMRGEPPEDKAPKALWVKGACTNKPLADALDMMEVLADRKKWADGIAKEAAAKHKEAQNQVIAALGKDRYLTDTHFVTVKKRSGSTRFDHKRYREENPKACEPYMVTYSDTQMLSVTKQKKKGKS